MADCLIRVIHSAGCAEVEVPDQITIAILIQELIDALQLPKVNAWDGLPLEYRLDSKEFGRRLVDNETIGGLGITPEDTLTLTVGVLAGSPKFYPVQVKGMDPSPDKSCIRVRESSIGLQLDDLADINFRTLLTNEAALTMTLHRFRKTLEELDNARQSLKSNDRENRQLSDRLREKRIGTVLMVLGQIQTGFGVNLITSNSTGGWPMFVAGLVLTTGALCFPLVIRTRSRSDSDVSDGHAEAAPNAEP